MHETSFSARAGTTRGAEDVATGAAASLSSLFARVLAIPLSRRAATRWAQGWAPSSPTRARPPPSSPPWPFPRLPPSPPPPSLTRTPSGLQPSPSPVKEGARGGAEAAPRRRRPHGTLVEEADAEEALPRGELQAQAQVQAVALAAAVVVVVVAVAAAATVATAPPAGSPPLSPLEAERARRPAAARRRAPPSPPHPSYRATPPGARRPRWSLLTPPLPALRGRGRERGRGRGRQRRGGRPGPGWGRRWRWQWRRPRRRRRRRRGGRGGPPPRRGASGGGQQVLEARPSRPEQMRERILMPPAR